MTELKIDKSFTIAVAEDRSNGVIVHSVVDLGHNIGLTLVAEGVESGEALAALAEYGCDVAQDYHLSRPISADAFDVWRAEHLAAVRSGRTAAAPSRPATHPEAALTTPS